MSQVMLAVLESLEFSQCYLTQLPTSPNSAAAQWSSSKYRLWKL